MDAITPDWEHLCGLKIIKSWRFHFSKKKRSTISQAIWTLFSNYLFLKNIFWLHSVINNSEKSCLEYPKWTAWFRSCPNLHERYQLLFFLNVDVSLRDYSSPLHKNNKVNFRTTFGTILFFHLISFKAPQNLETVEESRTKVEFDHHRVKTSTQAFHGWQSKLIF